MNCASCGRANRSGARFCSGCGQSLAPRCPRCGAENAADSQFCDACGAPLVAAAAPPLETSARKVVTIVFADLVGSVALHERLDAESARRFMARYHAAMTAVVHAHGGTVVQLLGDGVLTAFGVPRVGEDDAIRGVRAAVAMQAAFRELLREQAAAVGAVGLRIAVNTGEVIVSEDQTSVIGDPTNVAARLQQEARDGDVLLGEATRRVVAGKVTLESLGSFALRGRVEPVSAYRVVSLESPAGGQGTAFVGREDELRRLRAVFDTAVAAPSARMAVLLGSPGLGKSRLLGEFARRVSDRATVLSARCDPARGRSFAPIAAALRAQLGLADSSDPEATRAALDSAVPGVESERARLAAGLAALLAGAPASPEETFFVVRRLLAGLAGSRPVVLAIDDVQWAEPLLLDLAEHLVEWSSGVPLLVLLGSRPELRELRSSLATPGGVVADVVTLSGLDASAATRLAANAIGADELPAAVVGRVLAASEGNPLFVGELVRMLVQDGALRREGERWVAGVELARLEMPPTIHALLAARIERLGPDERAILERAAVVGRHFSRAAVAHLLQRDPAELDGRLESLRRSELIEPDSGWFLGEPGLRFHHALIRDAAYRRVLRRTRAELHERLADWIAAQVGEAPEHDERIGWHLQQAHEHLRELGPLDAHGGAVGARAARHLGAAGRMALARDELRLAADLLGRALGCLDSDDPTRADLALDWCEALLAAGEVGPASRAIEELARFARSSERLRAWHACFAAELAVLTDPKMLRSSAASAEAAAAALAAVADIAGEAKAHSVHATALARLGQIGASEAALDRALAAARRAHDRRRANSVLAGAPVAALYGPSPVARASGRCLDVVRVLRITQGAPAVEAVALRCQAVLEALRGRTDAARRMIAAARRTVEELGLAPQLLEVEFFAGYIELLEGEAETAARCLSVAYEGLREHGLGIDAARAAALLARARLAQGDAIGAEVLSQESERLAGDDLNAAIAWRGVRAEALARRGEHAAAVELARAAVEIAAATDALLQHANARRALAAALRAAGRDAEADAEDARAIELWEAKGASVLVERSRRDGAATATSREPERRRDPSARRRGRVRRNEATAHVERMDAAIAARDAAAIAELVKPSWVGVNHTTGVTYDWERNFAGLQSLLSGGSGVVMTHTPLGTLGDSLVLVRRATSFDQLSLDDVRFGAVERDDFALIEVDAQGRSERVDFFAGSQLGAAVTRLYERHAELLPEGPERERAAATARSVAALLGPADPDLWAPALAPGIEFVDARTVGPGTVRGLEAVLQSIRALFELSESFTVRIADVLALGSDALVVGWANSGERGGGGRFERDLCQLFAFGPDGRLVRWEQFDAASHAEALARFDALAAAATPQPIRRVRPNLATELVERMMRAFAARDLGAVEALLAADFVGWHRATDRLTDRRGPLEDLGELMSARDAVHATETLATLGDRLALFRRLRRFSALDNPQGAEFGPTVADDLLLIEVDARPLARRVEVFAENRLEEAVARLYARHAELLPEGPQRTRAAAIARSVDVCMQRRPDVDGFGGALAPGFRFSDHGVLGIGRERTGPELLAWLRSVFDVATDVDAPLEDVIDLRSDALLARRTVSGVDRTGGGRFERPTFRLWRFAADGRLERMEWFDLDRFDDALARFEALAERATDVRRRVRPNAATAYQERLVGVIRSRDPSRLPELLAEDFRAVDHNGETYDRHGTLQGWRTLMRSEDLSLEYEPLASLGDSLSLGLQSYRFGALAIGSLDLGPTRVENLILVEVDERGRARGSEVFAPERLGDAVVRLYQRQAELSPDPRERARLAATARSISAMLGPLDLARYETVFASDVVAIDHRLLGFGSLRGAAALLRGFGAMAELAELSTRIADVLALEPDSLVVRWSATGTDRAGGGEVVKEMILYWRFDADGRVSAVEQFDTDRQPEALARCSARSDEAASARLANAAARAMNRFERAWSARDWDGVVASYAPGHLMDDRRRLFRMQVGSADFVANERHLFELEDSRWHSEPLATRGERLGLFRVRFSARTEGGGPTAVEMFDVVEVDAAGRRSALVVFDADAREEALAELDRRYAAGEAASFPKAAEALSRFLRAIATRDWSAMRAVLAPDLVVEDHRPSGRETLIDPARYVETLESWVELAPDVQLRNDHLALAEHGALLVSSWVGTRDGGAVEAPRSVVLAVDPSGRIARMDLHDPSQLGAARARFAELARAGAPGPRVENAATRSIERFARAWARRDWAACAALFAPGFRCLDRRRLIQLELDRDRFLAFARELYERIESRLLHQTLATRGERLAAVRIGYTGSGDTIGPSETEQLAVIEVDERGDRIAMVRFDPEDLDQAYAELDRRYDAGEAAAHPAARETLRRLERATAARDWDSLASVFAPDLVFEDHRRMGFGTLRSRDEYLARLRALLELAPDARSRAEHVIALDARGVLNVGHWEGTREGGRFEIAGANLIAFGPEGRICRWDAYDLDQLDLARARFAELRPDLLRAPPNAASRLMQERLARIVPAGDWDALRALVTPDFAFDDRRKGALVRGDVEVYVRNLSFVHSWGEIATRRELLATSGDRLSLERFGFSGGMDEGAFEGEFLRLTELDARGRLRAVLHFDPDDRRAADAEMLARADPSPMRDFHRALNAHDLEGMRRMLRNDFVLDDHRRIGLGRLEGADACLASLAALFGEPPDAAVESLYELAADERGELAVTRNFGRLADGGSFERVFLRVIRRDRNKLASMELFELEQLERARACFDALDRAASPLARYAAGNAATAALDRLFAALAAKDWEGARRLCAAGAELERGLAELRRRVESGLRCTRTLIGYADPRSALERMRWADAESLWMLELDDAGRISVLREFPAEERSPALRELRRRLCARDPIAAAVFAPGIELSDALDARDAARTRAVLSDGFVLLDHRRMRLGVMEGPGAYAESVKVLGELASRVRVDTPFCLALEPHGVVSVVQVSGTLAQGGEFEGNHLALMTVAAGRVTRIEFFEPHEAERAAERLVELRPRQGAIA